MWFGTSNNCGVRLNEVGKDRETDEKDDEDCVDEGLHLSRENLTEMEKEAGKL